MIARARIKVASFPNTSGHHNLTFNLTIIAQSRFVDKTCSGSLMEIQLLCDPKHVPAPPISLICSEMRILVQDNDAQL
jgi:hypothetical protein